MHHSIKLDEEKCRGCTTCIKGCPTEAIRVHNGMAHIIADRCIDCGECVRTCPSGAKIAVSNSLDVLNSYDYTVALTAPSFYGQFSKKYSPDHILTALLGLGFDQVYEVAESAEIITELTKVYLDEEERDEPSISSSCPVIVRLLQLRFPSLLDSLIPMISPMELAARIVRKEQNGNRGRVGIFFISPCAAKRTTTLSPRGINKSEVDGVLGFSEIYKEMNGALHHIKTPQRLRQSSSLGISWARSEGEGCAIEECNHIAVDGITHVIDFLEQLEDGQISGNPFIELMCCPGGCVGGPLVAANPFLAKSRVMAHERDFVQPENFTVKIPDISPYWDFIPEAESILRLDKDYKKAMEMMADLEKIQEGLPGLDCGSCGSPSCHSLAEDIVRGKAQETDCIFKLREKIRSLTQEMIDLEWRVSPAMDKE